MLHQTVEIQNHLTMSQNVIPKGRNIQETKRGSFVAGSVQIPEVSDVHRTSKIFVTPCYTSSLLHLLLRLSHYGGTGKGSQYLRAHISYEQKQTRYQAFMYYSADWACVCVFPCVRLRGVWLSVMCVGIARACLD